MAQLFMNLKRMYKKSDMNSTQFNAAAKAAAKEVDAEEKKSKLQPSGDGISSSSNDSSSSKTKAPKMPSNYNSFIGEWISNYDGNPHEAMKAGAHHWTHGGGKQEWEERNR